MIKETDMNKVNIGFVWYHMKRELSQSCFIVSKEDNIEELAREKSDSIYDCINPETYGESEDEIQIEIFDEEECHSEIDVINFFAGALISYEDMDEEDFEESDEYQDIVEIAKLFPDAIEMNMAADSFNDRYLQPVY